MSSPSEFTLELTPRNRCDAVDIRELLRQQIGNALDRYRRALYCSHHTTAGFLDQRVGAKLRHHRDLYDFIGAFQHIFPANADYTHDKMHLRSELTAEQKRVEPKNADSHFTFMSSGLSNCLTSEVHSEHPVYLVDLDGIWEHGVRRRKTSIVGYNEEVTLASAEFALPVSEHPLDSVNVFDEGLGALEELNAFVARHDVAKGRLDIELADEEEAVGLTVNEYETLLMQKDLREVLRDPLRFIGEKGRNALRDLKSVPHKTLNYAQYDLVHALNELVDVVGASESILERLLAKLIALPASRLLGMKRSVSFLVSADQGASSIVRGTYQSPIMVQWRKADGGQRRLRARLVDFE